MLNFSPAFHCLIYVHLYSRVHIRICTHVYTKARGWHLVSFSLVLPLTFWRQSLSVNLGLNWMVRLASDCPTMLQLLLLLYWITDRSSPVLSLMWILKIQCRSSRSHMWPISSGPTLSHLYHHPFTPLWSISEYPFLSVTAILFFSNPAYCPPSLWSLQDYPHALRLPTAYLFAYCLRSFITHFLSPLHYTKISQIP